MLRTGGDLVVGHRPLRLLAPQIDTDSFAMVAGG
jgi:cold shock protein